MKPTSRITIHHRQAAPGFALIVTLSLMVLLALVAIGLLSLSSIALRSASQGAALAEARSNARLALILALGELQKQAGTDIAVTAPGGITSNKPRMRHLTGVWGSWDPLAENGAGAPDYDGAKDDNFRAWLVSDADQDAVMQRGYDGPADETIVLVGSGSLGIESPDPADTIAAGTVPIANGGGVSGAYAWHVSDESCKARINACRDPKSNDFPWRKMALLGGHRPDPSVVTAPGGSALSFLPGDSTEDEFKKAEELSGKLTGLDQYELLPDGESIGRFRHHVTPYSFGLLANVREGGLKQDLSSMFEMQTMPASYGNSKLYQSTHGITGPSDPNWSVLKDYYDVFKDPSMSASSPVYYKSPSTTVSLTDSRDVPTRFQAVPVIARVEMLFSVVVRDSHGPWSPPRTGLTKHTRMVHLLYAPIVTLHNPYNVSLKFDRMDLDINGIPIAFNFFVNGQAQNNGTVPYNQMYVNLQNRAAKAFMLSISNWKSFGSNSESPIIMKPGQSLVCGPYIDGNAIFGNSGNEGSRVFFDYRNDLTGSTYARAKCKPGFLGKQVAFDVDWITPDNAPYSTDGRRGVLIVTPRDKLHIEHQMKPNEFGGKSTDKMTVSAKLKVGGKEVEIGGLEFDYDEKSIRKHHPTVYRYPDDRSRPNTLLVEQLWESNQTPIRSHTRVRPFALLTARARTANGGVYDNATRDEQANAPNLLKDGKLAGIPLLHHNPARTPTVVDLKRDLPGRYSHELDLQPLAGTVEDLYDIDAANRGYLLTANTAINGIKSGSYLELPTAPLQTIADFRRSNVLASSMLPNFVQPIANSHSSPLIATDRFIQSGIVDYPLLDHSFLANHALYDRFYFSTFSTYSSAQTPGKVFSGFMDGTQQLAAQSFAPYQRAGSTPAEAEEELFSGGKPSEFAYKKAAEYQLVRTPFNVNSVDVEAWKAVLSSLSGSTIQQLWATSALRDEKDSELTPLLPMSLVNGGAVGNFNLAKDVANIDNEWTNDFNGYHELGTNQLERLAEEIVKEVRERGPFLSLSEFVNRRIGPSSPETMAGALQTAIDESGINDNFLGASVIPVRDLDVADPRTYSFANPAASFGNPAAGAPGWLTQGDLMRVLEPGATVRGDTFVIRTCGQSLDRNGQVKATAYAEAVVQRIPDYLDPADRPSDNVWDPNASGTSEQNKRFGRRFMIVSFRWLSKEEI